MFEWPTEWADRARDLFQRDGDTIRLMRPDDLDEVLRIIRLHDSDDYKAARQSFPMSRFDLPLEQTGHFVLESTDPEAGRRVVGVSGYYIDDLESRGIYWLGWTYVNPFAQGRGYGGKLLSFVINAVEELGARKLYLSTSSLPSFAKAVGFYKHHGFVQEGLLRDYYSEGDDKLIMARVLNPRPQRAVDSLLDQLRSPSGGGHRGRSGREDDAGGYRGRYQTGRRDDPRDAERERERWRDARQRREREDRDDGDSRRGGGGVTFDFT